MNSRAGARGGEDHTAGSSGEMSRGRKKASPSLFWWQETAMRSAQLSGKLSQKSQKVSKALEAVSFSLLSSCFPTWYIRFVCKTNV